MLKKKFLKSRLRIGPLGGCDLMIVGSFKKASKKSKTEIIEGIPSEVLYNSKSLSPDKDRSMFEVPEYKPIKGAKIKLKADDLEWFNFYGTLPNSVSLRLALNDTRNNAILKAVKARLTANKKSKVLIYALSPAHARALSGMIFISGKNLKSRPVVNGDGRQAIQCSLSEVDQSSSGVIVVSGVCLKNYKVPDFTDIILAVPAPIDGIYKRMIADAMTDPVKNKKKPLVKLIADEIK